MFFYRQKIKDGHNCPMIISVNYRFTDELFDNTLFDGELLEIGMKIGYILLII